MPEKPSKPYPGFPLYPHASGKWAKKVKGRMFYFGRWEDPLAALAEYESMVGLGSPRDSGPYPLSLAVQEFLDEKQNAVDNGELVERTLSEYRMTLARFEKHVGKRSAFALTPDDFSSFRSWRAKTLNPVSTGNEVTRIRSFCNWLRSRKKIPIELPDDFKKPGRMVLRRLKREKGRELFSQNDIHLILDEAGVHLRAMVLLGINCGFGPGDCASLLLTDVDLDAGWIDYPRPKTGVDRLCPLWPETVEALGKSLERRRGEGEHVFLKPSGQTWASDQPSLSKYFTSVRSRVLMKGGFYWLRKTFATVASATGDQVAVNAIMGHVDSSIAAVYRQEIQKERLVRVTDHVRNWLVEEVRAES